MTNQGCELDKDDKLGWVLDKDDKLKVRNSTKMTN